ncbi:unnamed protein product, partial [Ectocarpus sp. 4 AP-2014]
MLIGPAGLGRRQFCRRSCTSFGLREPATDYRRSLILLLLCLSPPPSRTVVHHMSRYTFGHRSRVLRLCPLCQPRRAVDTSVVLASLLFRFAERTNCSRLTFSSSFRQATMNLPA